MNAVEIRGVARDFPNEKRRIIIVSRETGGNRNHIDVYPEDEPLSKKAIRKFIAGKVGVGLEEVQWAEHVRIPKDEKRKEGL